jgi:hypothetical protein
MVNKEKLQKDYTTVVKEKEEAKKKEERIFNEKDEVEQQEERIQRVVHKLYKDIPEVSMVVEATLEE